MDRPKGAPASIIVVTGLVLPIRNDYLVRLPGLAGPLSMVVRLDEPDLPVPGPWTATLPLGDLGYLRIRLES
jgi:hypothetical protein